MAYCLPELITPLLWYGQKTAIYRVPCLCIWALGHPIDHRGHISAVQFLHFFHHCHLQLAQADVWLNICIWQWHRVDGHRSVGIVVPVGQGPMEGIEYLIWRNNNFRFNFINYWAYIKPNNLVSKKNIEWLIEICIIKFNWIIQEEFKNIKIAESNSLIIYKYLANI